jgi:hypothetical protein
MTTDPEAIKAFFDSCEDRVRVDPVDPSIPNLLLIRWSLKGMGFGELTLLARPDGLFLDSEAMSAETVKKILGMAVDDAYAHGRTDNHTREQS